MKLIDLFRKKVSGTKNICSVCGKDLKKTGQIYRGKNREKYCVACYLKWNPPCKERTAAASGNNGFSSPLANPEAKAKWEACSLPFANPEKPRSRQELVAQSKAFYRSQHTGEEKRKFEEYRENTLKILDKALWNQQQDIRTKQKAEMEKAAKEKEKQRHIQELKWKEERKQKAKKNKKEWLEHLEPFVFDHAKTSDCAELIYAYIRDIVHMNEYPEWGKNPAITENAITITHHSFACSFFDDGGSESEDCTFRLWYAGDEEIDETHNERINNPKPYDQKSYTHSIHDLFYCEDPLGLSGIYGFQFDYEHESISPAWAEN